MVAAAVAVVVVVVIPVMVTVAVVIVIVLLLAVVVAAAMAGMHVHRYTLWRATCLVCEQFPPMRDNLLGAVIRAPLNACGTRSVPRYHLYKSLVF